jgi:bla regulator protein BlaR1
MILQSLSLIWTDIAAPLGNHLWQSTLFALAAGLLTLLLRKHRAHVRYSLWLAASLKFLVPFSLLVDLGSHLSWPRGSAAPNSGLYLVIDQVSRPFTQTTSTLIPAPPSTLSSTLVHLLPALLVVWLCGFGAVLLIWCFRWQRISAAVRKALPLREGRELEALYRSQRIAGMPQRIALRLSHTRLEPGIFGILRPVLVWPRGISGRLDDAHLEAIIAHELWHVRRRDNLAAALHMLVEAIFWFHPLVWWLGSRLLDERERACDEAVIASGGDCHVYAESILKICEFCVGSPLPCVSGVTGAGLQRRIARIMTGSVARNLNLTQKLLLVASALVAVAVPLATGLLNAKQILAASQENIAMPTVKSASARAGVIPDWLAQAGTVPSFQIAFVRENKSGNEFATMNVPLLPGPDDAGTPTSGLLSGTNVSLISCIYFAYKLTGSQFQLLLPNVPNWTITDKFDIQAKAVGNPSTDQLRLIMQSVLSDRFHLAAHYETRQVPVFALVLSKPGKTGPQLQPHPNDSSCATTTPPTSPASAPTSADRLPAACGRIEGQPSRSSGRMRVAARSALLGLLADYLAQMGNLDRPVLDHTELGATYDFTFEWTARRVDRANPHGTEPDPAFLQDLNNQLGLRLEPRTGSVDVLVIDRIEKPAETEAQNTAAIPAFAVVSIKANKAATESLKTGKGIIRQRMMINPGELTATGNTLRELIRFFDGVEAFQITGGPDWLKSEIYDVEAKADQPSRDVLNKLAPKEQDAVNQHMLEALLADRFKLVLHHETKQLLQYSLVVAQSGKLHAVQGDCPHQSADCPAAARPEAGAAHRPGRPPHHRPSRATPGDNTPLALQNLPKRYPATSGTFA